MRIDLDRVPARETGMSAYEIYAVGIAGTDACGRPERREEPAVKAIFEKWDLHAEIIGEVIEGDRLVIRYRGKVVVDVPPDSLVLGGGAPVYIRESAEPAYLG